METKGYTISTPLIFENARKFLAKMYPEVTPEMEEVINHAQADLNVSLRNLYNPEYWQDIIKLNDPTDIIRYQFIMYALYLVGQATEQQYQLQKNPELANSQEFQEQLKENNGSN